MRCVLNTRATFYALLSLIAVIAAVRVILPSEDIVHMADHDNAAADAAAQILVRENALKDWFSTDSPNGAVNADNVQQFLDELAEIQFMPTVAAPGRADAIIDAGHTSIHNYAGRADYSNW